MTTTTIIYCTHNENTNLPHQTIQRLTRTATDRFGKKIKSIKQKLIKKTLTYKRLTHSYFKRGRGWGFDKTNT